MRRVALLTSVCLVALIAGGCRHDGRTLRPAKANQTASISTTIAPADTDSVLEPSSTAPVPFPDAGLTLVAPWRDGATIDERATCDGLNVSPALTWSAAPAGTVEIAIVMVDLDAPGFTHWVLAGLPASSTSLAEDTVPLGAYEGTNGNGVIGYTGPCPPAGQTHTYVLTVYYLGDHTGLGDGTPGQDLLDAVVGVELDEASVTGTFSRP